MAGWHGGVIKRAGHSGSREGFRGRGSWRGSPVVICDPRLCRLDAPRTRGSRSLGLMGSDSEWTRMNVPQGHLGTEGRSSPAGTQLQPAAMPQGEGGPARPRPPRLSVHTSHLLSSSCRDRPVPAEDPPGLPRRSHCRHGHTQPHTCIPQRPGPNTTGQLRIQKECPAQFVPGTSQGVNRGSTSGLVAPDRSAGAPARTPGGRASAEPPASPRCRRWGGAPAQQPPTLPPRSARGGG